MSERNFLSEFIQEEIYLIEQDQSSSKSQSSTQKYLVITPKHLPETDLEFLHKIFKAIKVTPDQLEVSAEEPVDESFLAIFYFGKIPEDWAGNYYQKDPAVDTPTIVAHTLSEIATDNGKKRKLWSVLQELA